MSNTAENIVDSLLGDNPKDFALDLIGQQNQELAAVKASGVVNPKTVAQYGHIYHKTQKKADGTACSVKVTSVKTWKTRPGEFEIGWKYGLKQYGTITPRNADEWTTIEPPAVKPEKRRR